MSEHLSLLESLDLDNVPELAPVNPGEYELRVVSAQVVDGNTPGTKNICIIFAIEGEPNASNVFRYLALPNSSDSAAKVDQKRRFIKDVFDALDMTIHDVDNESAKGKTAWAILNVEEYEGVERNNIKKFIRRA